MKIPRPFGVALLFAFSAAVQAAEINLSETLQLPECHSIGWVSAWIKADPTAKGSGWNGVIDEAKWGTPSPDQIVARNWDWKITEAQWAAAVQLRGEGKRQDVKFDLWIPDGVEVVKGIIVLSAHGSGETVFINKAQSAMLKAVARELNLATFKFLGDPMQRGFWPKSLLYERLNDFAKKSGHPELQHAPLFLYGHSNGTGFSAVFPSTEGHRVWGWISMRPGITFQVYQPGAAQIPGLVIFGEDDAFLTRPSREENLAVVPLMRKQHSALWNFAVEPKTGHGPGDHTWPFVFSFLRHTFNARVPADADPQKGPVKLNTIIPESGFLGQNWDPAQGGYQNLQTAPYSTFNGDKSTASWLVNAAYAADWQAFQRDGKITSTVPQKAASNPSVTEPPAPATPPAPAIAPASHTPPKLRPSTEPPAEAAKQAVRIQSSKDSTEQLAIWHRPESASPELQGDAVHLLVFLHSWSGGFEQGLSFVSLAKKMGWAFIAPDFRGPNNRPEACASELASQDVLDAVQYATAHARIDPNRIYLYGNSGGGHMALVMATRAPDLWAGVSSWVPISDLAAWHAESTDRKNNYAKMLEKSCGGPPSSETEKEYRARSPLFHLAAAKSIPLDLNTGIHDGHTGSVPVSHSLHAFNALADASSNSARKIGEADITSMVREQRIPTGLASDHLPDPERQRAVLFRRVAGQARISVFDGGHDSEGAAAISWLARQRRGQPANFTLGTAPASAAEAVAK